MKLAIIGAGWAGMAAAVEAIAAGLGVVIFEASRTLGGRARAVPDRLPDDTPVSLDNGQHILIGAYSETLRLMQHVGIDPELVLLRLPLTLLFPDGAGLRFPAWPTPLDALAGIVGAHGWHLQDKWSLLRVAGTWWLRGFQCGAKVSVAQLCQGLSPHVMADLIEPLCISALNTPARRASAQVFLRVMKDALFGIKGGSNLLLPRVDLSALFPAPGSRYLRQHGAQVHLGARIATVLQRGSKWQVQGELFDAVILATSATESTRVLQQSAKTMTAASADSTRHWRHIAQALPFEAITTVYAWAADATLDQPMLALRSDPAPCTTTPAQFVFDRGQLGGPKGLLAFVVSASHGDRATLQAQVLQQARRQLGFQLQAVQTVVERRATLACTPDLRRPGAYIAPGLLACGDYVAGPYPSTLEGAVRSGVAAAALITA